MPAREIKLVKASQIEAVLTRCHITGLLHAKLKKTHEKVRAASVYYPYRCLGR